MLPRILAKVTLVKRPDRGPSGAQKRKAKGLAFTRQKARRGYLRRDQ